MTTQSTTDSAYRRAVTVTVNGKEFTRDVDTRTTLADWLREDLQLVSVHLGCEQARVVAATCFWMASRSGPV